MPEQHNDQGKTKKAEAALPNQPQEPMPSRDASWGSISPYLKGKRGDKQGISFHMQGIAAHAARLAVAHEIHGSLVAIQPAGQYGSITIALTQASHQIVIDALALYLATSAEAFVTSPSPEGR